MKEIRMLFSLVLRVFIVLAGWCAIFYLIYGLGSGHILLWDLGIAADSNGNVYVGNTKYIHVYSFNGEKSHEIYAQTDSHYSFTIRNDELYIKCAGEVIVLDLQGSVIRYEDVDNIFWYRVSANTYTSDDGTQYKLTNMMGRKAIMVNSHDEWDVIAKMPMQNYCIILLCFVFISLAAISVMSIIYQFRKDKF